MTCGLCEHPAPACRVCGCTEWNACWDEEAGRPCSWAEADLCSACARKQKAS